MIPGIYAGKFKIGDKVASANDVYPDTYFGEIVGINTTRSENYAYQVHWKDDFYDDGSAMTFFYSEEMLDLI